MAMRGMFFDPFRELGNLQRQMNELLDTRRWWGERRPRGREFPPLNVTAAGDEIHVSAELPGVKLDDIALSITGDILTIKGERKPDGDVKEETYQRREREFGKFTRTIRLKQPVAGEKAEAHYANGILEIRIPKAEEAKSRKIAVRSE